MSEAGGSDQPPRAETNQRRQRGADRRQKEQTMTAKTVINTDGACYGNPGPVGFAAPVKGVDKTYQWGGAKVYHQRGHWPA